MRWLSIFWFIQHLDGLNDPTNSDCFSETGSTGLPYSYTSRIMNFMDGEVRVHMFSALVGCAFHWNLECLNKFAFTFTNSLESLDEF